ncbi:hypothetical protein ACHQM5_022019 [Ranunculus cassubicifolius]
MSSTALSSNFKALSLIGGLNNRQLKRNSYLAIQYHHRNSAISTNLCPKNSNFIVKKCSSMNGYPINRDLDMEAKERARCWVRSGTAIVELLQIFHIPTLIAISIMSRIAIAMGRQATLLVECSIHFLAIYWYLGFLWRALPSEKQNLFSAPQDFFLAVIKLFQEFFDKFGKVRRGIKKYGWQFGGLATSMLEECAVVGYKLKRIGGGDVDEVQMLKKKHRWINVVAFLFACTVLDYISIGVTKAYN